MFRASASRVALSALAVVSLAAVSACGGSSSSTGSASAPSVAAQTPTATTSASGATSTPSASVSSAKPTPTVKKKAITSADAVSVTGDFGKRPTVTAPYPFAIDKTASKVLVEGSGAPIARQSFITFNYEGIDATTGKSFDSSWNKGRTPLTSPATGLIPGFTTSIVGKKVGDRVLMVINSKDGYDQAGGQGAIKVGDTLIFVVDIVNATLPGPTGAAVAAPANLPTVGKDAKGFPTLTIDTSKPVPTTVTSAALTTGTGAVVKPTDTVQVNYRAYDMLTGKLVLSDYEGGPESGVLNTQLQAWQQALVGKKVGSRVLIIAPNAYPNGNATPSVGAGTTLAFVVDVLFAYTASNQ